MSAASPPSPPPPGVSPVPPTSPAPAPPPGELHETGTVRRDSVDIERWTARGWVKVTGDVRVGDGDVDGTVSIGGKLTATALRYRGTIDVEGAVDVRGRLSGAGSLRTALTLHAGEADLEGTARLLGAVAVDRALTVQGSLSAPSLVVGTLDLHGEARIPGEVTGLSVTARLASDSSFGTVKGKSVVLRARVPNLVERVFGRKVTASAVRVEADSAELEAVDVKFVRAPKIVLGRHAHLTEYEGTIVRRHPSSRVGFESRSPPPYGLSR